MEHLADLKKRMATSQPTIPALGSTTIFTLESTPDMGPAAIPLRRHRQRR